MIAMQFEGSQSRQASLILGHVVRTVGVGRMDLIVRTVEQVKERLRISEALCARSLSTAKSFIKQTTLEWTDKAENDWNVAQANSY